MENENISLIAQLIEDHGILKVALSMLLAGIAVTFPILISWLKDLTKRNDEKKLYAILNTLGDGINMIASQYADSLSKQQVEVLLDTIYKKEFWELHEYVREIIEKNDVEEDKAGIEDRIKMQVKISFKEIENDLKKFKYKNRMVSEFLAIGTWELEVYNSLVKCIFDPRKVPCMKKTINMKSLLSTEFGNIHFLTMQNIYNY